MHALRLTLTLLLLTVAGSLHAQRRLSPDATISVITCGPGQNELYSAFGHSALRVYDPRQQIDEAYNYGVFDFDQPHFYLNFARGYLYYQLAVWDYQAFASMYMYENRFIHEQVLNLTPQQKQRVYDFLQWNALPENRFYRYDYFYDNCATRIRDVFVRVFKDSVQFDGSYIDTRHTIRELTDLYLKYQPWGDLGIDICLGLPMDKVADPYEYMFLPDYIESGFDHATIYQGSERVPLVSEKFVVYNPREEDPPRRLPHPLFVFSIAATAIAAISIIDLRRGKATNAVDAVLFGITGLIGLLLLSLWLFTDHAAAARNMNILWALPTHLIAVFMLKRRGKGIRIYFLITAILSAALLIFWNLLPQMLNYSLIPIVIALGIRAFVRYRLMKR